ncbi:MAG: hypothetical protein ACREGB_00830 [Candidatus Saccharimonadales bacterium]
MPLRALTYVLSAVNIRDNMFPQAQLQVIYPLAAAEKINKVNAFAARCSAQQLEIAATGINSFLTGVPRMVFCESTDVPDEDLTKEVEAVVRRNPAIEKRFVAKARNGKQDSAAYIAAHVMVHDTPANLRDAGVMARFSETIDSAPRIISIGAQSEQPFYAASMACRRAGVLPAAAVEVTGQLFTRHVLPPYIACREGEPNIFDFGQFTGEPINHPVASVQRDLRFMQERVGPTCKENLL